MSHNSLEHPPDGEDLEVKGDRLDELQEFLPGQLAAEHVKEHLSDYGEGTKMSWAIISLLGHFKVQMSPKTQDLLLQNIKQAYECLNQDK